MIDLHGLNQTLLQGEQVTHVLIGKHGSGQIAHDLMHLDQDLPSLLCVKGNWLDLSIDLAPLLRPVSAYFLMPTDKTAFERPRPSDIGSHKGEGGINVTRVEGYVCCA